MRFNIKNIVIPAALLLLILIVTACSSGGTNGNKQGGNDGKTDPTDTQEQFDDPSIKIEKNPVLQISELMMINRVTVADASGEYNPWIELHNISGGFVEMSEYRLSYGTESYSLPAGLLAPDGYALVFLSEKECPLKLAANGTLALFHGDLLAHRVPYFNSTANSSFLVSTGTETPMPTPGYKDVREKDQLVITEVMSKNTCYPINGSLTGFVEIYNAGSNSVDLGNYYVTDSETFIYRTRLPDKVLNSGEYIVLTADRDLPVTPSENGGTVIITRNDGVRGGYISYPALSKNTSYTSNMEVSDRPTPGFANSESGYMAYVSSRSGVLINEVITSNTKYKKTDNDYFDMIELVNTSSSSVNLSDYYISDSQKDLKRYQLPNYALAPGEIYTVIASGKGGAQANFKLSQDGEKLFVSNGDGYIIDAIDIPFIPTDRSYGRYNGQLVYFATPSFGMANPFGYTSLSPEPKASVSSGFYKSGFNVTLSSESGDIYYTLDGSAPTSKSKKYSGETIPVTASTSLRALCCDGDKIPSQDVTFNYFLNTPDLTLPIVKVTVEHESMYGTNGIFTNYNKKTEVPAHVAMYVDGNEEFSVNCGLKVFGAYSRRFQKKSYQLKFRAQYGCSKLKYDVFEDGEITEFNSLVLRSGSQDYYRAMMRDEFATKLASDYTDLLVQKYRPVSVFINDEYVGVYYIREKINDDFVASHYNVSPESVTIVNFVGMAVETGTLGTEWKNLWNFIKNNDLTKEENYKYICDNISVESIIDFYIFMAWSDNRDSGNVRVFKSTEGDGKWRFIYFDVDLGFGVYENPNRPTVRALYEDYTPNEAPYNALIYKLFRNNTFKDLFLKRLAELTSTAFSNDEVLTRINSLEELIDNDISLSPRLANEYLTPPTYSTWKNTWMKKLKTFVTDRGELLRNDFASLLKLTAAEKQKYFGN